MRDFIRGFAVIISSYPHTREEKEAEAGKGAEGAGAEAEGAQVLLPPLFFMAPPISFAHHKQDPKCPFSLPNRALQEEERSELEVLEKKTRRRKSKNFFQTKERKSSGIFFFS